MANLIVGTNLGEVLNGTAGDDIIIGNEGNDRINGRGGIDILIGGLGNDIFFVTEPSDVIIESPGGGTDTIFSAIDYVATGEIESLRASGTDNIDLEFLGTTSITISGNSGNNLLGGGDGDDTLNGRDGDDDLAGGDGNDYLIGGIGNDTLRGGLGEDTMVGGAGDDIYRVRESTDIVVEGSGAGNDSILTVVDYDLSNSQHVETLRGISSDDLSLWGNNKDNTILGSAGDDILGGEGGNDILRGNAGDDVLIGGAGDDLMVGGSGADVFVFTDNEGNDRVQDFSAGDGDVIVFDSVDGVFGLEDLTLTVVAGGANTLVTYGDEGRIILVGVGQEDQADLLESILFVPNDLMLS